MTIAIVSSMNLKLYEAYGQRFIEEFLTHKSDDVELVIVFEDGIPQGLGQRDGLACLELKQSRHDQFIRFFGHLYEANGIRFTRQQMPDGRIVQKAAHNFRFNAVRFSFKIFSLLAARTHFGQDRAFAWLDADMRCLKGFTAADLDVFMPHGDEIMSYLGRSHYPQPEPYSECGFLGFNPAHDQTSPYLERMESLYLTGEIFSISQWHDSWLWDHVRKEFESEGHGFKNLSGEMMKEDHPFINCGLGAFFDHLKGPQRKKAGRSFDSDYVKK